MNGLSLFQKPFQKNGARRRGQGMAEYGLIIGLIAVVCLVSLGNTGTKVKGLLEVCHTAAAGGGDNCAALSCGTSPCSNGCRCSPNYVHCHDPSCD